MAEAEEVNFVEEEATNHPSAMVKTLVVEAKLEATLPAEEMAEVNLKMVKNKRHPT